MATPACLLPGVTIARLRRASNKLGHIAIQKYLVCCFLSLRKWTEDYSVCLLGKLMSDKTLHSAQEELRQEILDQFLRCYASLFKLIECRVMTYNIRICEPQSRWVTHDCPVLRGLLILDSHIDSGPNRPGFVQLRSVHSSSYLFCIAVPVRPILHNAFTWSIA
jgi:hypothetical protein